MKKFLLFVLLLIGDCTIAFAQHQIPMQIINKGKTTIKGINGVTINDSFEVKNGASIEIRAN